MVRLGTPPPARSAQATDAFAVTRRFAERLVSYRTSHGVVLVGSFYQVHTFPWNVLTGDGRFHGGFEKVGLLVDFLWLFAASQGALAESPAKHPRSEVVAIISSWDLRECASLSRGCWPVVGWGT